MLAKEHRILLLGLDAAGKSTFLNFLTPLNHVGTMCSIGFITEDIRYKDLFFNCWDWYGSLEYTKKTRVLWRHYFEHAEAIVWMMDSNDTDRDIDGFISFWGDNF